MKSKLLKDGMDLAQNIHVHLTNAVNAAVVGGDYDVDWEKAMQYQTELLRVINQLKFVKPEKVKNEA